VEATDDEPGKAGVGPPGEAMTPVKIPVEECVALDVHELERAGYFAPGPGRRRLELERNDRYLATLTLVMGESRFSLEGEVYPSPGTMTWVGTTIQLVHTPAINQGERLWFSCPVCHQRVGKLYLPPGRTMFLCRHCHNLTYRSRVEKPNIWRKAREEEPKLRRELQNPRLGWKRQVKSARKLDKLRAELERASLQTESMAPPELIDLFEDLGLWRRREPPQPQAAPEPALSVPERRPRGRPKEKRPYQRQKPFHGSERKSRAEAFCVKCRAYRESAEWTLVTFRNGRPALQGHCPVCGSKVARIITARGAALWASAPVHPPHDASFFD
jgi:hypothetical protein